MTECPICGLSNPTPIGPAWYCDGCKNAWDRTVSSEVER